MAGITVVSAEDMGNDVLIVRGTAEATEADGTTTVELTAQGWVSAMEAHVDSPPVEGDEAVVAKTRAMTADERRGYCARLLEEQNPRFTVRAGSPIDLGQ